MPGICRKDPVRCCWGNNSLSRLQGERENITYSTSQKAAYDIEEQTMGAKAICLSQNLLYSLCQTWYKNLKYKDSVVLASWIFILLPSQESTGPGEGGG